MFKKIVLFIFCLFTIKVFAQDKITHLLDNIQQKLTWDTSKESLLVYINTMDKMLIEKPNPYTSYWNAYAKYLLYFEYNLKNEDENKKAEQTLEEALKLIEKIQNKTSEHYALLSLLGGLQLNFTNSLMLPFKASLVGKNAKKAIELNPKNIRAYLALGIYDYYTPKMYGGMKITEENLKKAVALTEKIDPNPLAPDWGKSDAFLYLVKFYNYEKKFDDAKKYLDEGLKLYPNFELLKKMKVKLEKNG